MKKKELGNILIQMINKYENIEEIEHLIKQGADIDAKDEDGLTPLMSAITNVNEEVIPILLEYGADIEVTNDDGWNALTYAAISNHTEVVQLLLEHGADVNEITDRETPIIHASMWFHEYGGQLGTIKILLEYGANIDETGPDGMTPLMYAARTEYIEVVQFLLEYGANIDEKDYKGRTALQHATQCGQKEIVKLLLDKGAKPINDYTNIDKYEYVEKFVKHPTILKKFLENGMDINISDENDNSLLMAAAQLDRIDTIKFLLANKADINRKNFYGETPLSFAHSDEVKELLTNKGGVDAKCNYCSREYSSYFSQKNGIDGFCSPLCKNEKDAPERERMRLEHEAKEAEKARIHALNLARERQKEKNNQTQCLWCGTHYNKEHSHFQLSEFCSESCQDKWFRS